MIYLQESGRTANPVRERKGEESKIYPNEVPPKVSSMFTGAWEIVKVFLKDLYFFDDSLIQMLTVIHKQYVYYKIERIK